MKKIIVAVAALALMASSAYAAEWNFYGKAMLWTGWSDMDPVKGNGNGDAYDTQYNEGLYTDSKVGANVKVSDELTARFEYQLRNNGDVRLEHLYGAWNFGSGTLTVGHTDTPINVAYSNQMVMVDDLAGNSEDLGLGGFGDFDNGQNAEIMLTFGGFSIAFLDPDDDNAYGASTQAIIPMIAACYKATFDMGEVQIAGGYNTFEVDDDEDFDAYGIGLGTQLNFGAFGMFATFVWGQNMANLGAGTATENIYACSAAYDAVNHKFNDCESIGGTIGVTFAVNDMLALEAGYGYIHDEFDDGDYGSSIAQSYYLQVPITLAPGVTVTPEVGMIDEREAGADETIYFGAAWAIAF